MLNSRDVWWIVGIAAVLMAGSLAWQYGCSDTWDFISDEGGTP